MTDWRKQLIKQAEMCCNIGWGLTKMVKEPEQLMVWLDAFEQGLLFGAYAEPEQEEVEEKLTKRFGPHVGLNADWSVQAWLVEGKTHHGHEGLFIIDNEDDTWSLVRRESVEDDNDIIDDVEYFGLGGKLLEWLGEERRRELLKPRSWPVKLPRGVKVVAIGRGWALVDDEDMIDALGKLEYVQRDQKGNLMRPEQLAEAQLAYLAAVRIYRRYAELIPLGGPPDVGMYVRTGHDFKKLTRLKGQTQTTAERMLAHEWNISRRTVYKTEHYQKSWASPLLMMTVWLPELQQIRQSYFSELVFQFVPALATPSSRHIIEGLPMPKFRYAEDDNLYDTLRPDEAPVAMEFHWSLRSPRMNPWTRRERG